MALKDISNGYKYAVTCAILQKGEMGLHLSSTCFWDAASDGSFSVRWENGTMHCILNVFAMAF